MCEIAIGDDATFNISSKDGIFEQRWALRRVRPSLLNPLHLANERAPKIVVGAVRALHEAAGEPP